MKKYSQTLKVRSYEIDAQGHVNYAVYLNYMEYCRVASLEQIGLPFESFIKSGKFVVIVEVNIKYLAPAFLGDELEVTLEGTEAGRTSIKFIQEIFNVKTKKKIASAQLAAVFISREGKPMPVDEEFKTAFF
ncbi:MAG: acyl-CoA thioesterase [Candidatus Zhuqueibacterota bacterium]